MSGVIIHKGADVFVDADWSKVVPGNSPEAAFLLVGSNGRVPAEYADLYLDSLKLDEVQPAEVELPVAEPEPPAEVEPPVAETAKPKRSTSRKTRS